MKLYIAPPKGKLEKESYILWLNNYKIEWVFLDQGYKIKGPLLLCGGADLGKDPQRDEKEIKWIGEAISGGYPILGICRGMQILNQYFGGKVETIGDYMVEDHKAGNFAENIDHSGKPSQYHIVQDLNGNLTNVNSRHHQYCSVLGKDLKATHVSYPNTNSIIEGFVNNNLKICAVQWHPERMESDDNSYPLNMIYRDI